MVVELSASPTVGVTTVGKAACSPRTRKDLARAGRLASSPSPRRRRGWSAAPPPQGLCGRDAWHHVWSGHTQHLSNPFCLSRCVSGCWPRDTLSNWQWRIRPNPSARGWARSMLPKILGSLGSIVRASSPVSAEKGAAWSLPARRDSGWQSGPSAIETPTCPGPVLNPANSPYPSVSGKQIPSPTTVVRPRSGRLFLSQPV